MVAPRWFLCPLLALVLSAPTVRASEGWPVARGPSREPVPFQYDATHGPAIPREFLDDAAACVIYSGVSHLLEADGTVETITHEVTRLSGRKAIEKLGEYRSILFDPAFQKLTLNEARVHKADGRLVPLSARHAQLRDVSTDYQVYDHEKQLILSFPNLEVGDTLEVKWTLRGKNPEHGGHFFTRYSFGDSSYPVVTDELRVRLPKNRPFRFATVVGKIDPVRTESGDQVTYHWKAGNCPQLPQDENQPSKEELTPAVACSTFPSWEEVGRWKQQLRAESWQCTPEICNVVEDVTRGLAGATDRARALTYWLRRHVRYVSEGEKHDYTPTPPAQVFANRFGDCKDTSQLLAVMLRQAGVPVELATLGVLDDGQVLEEVPSPWGTHAILLVTIGGQDHWIDTTLSLGAWDYLPRDDRNRLCYLVDDRGKVRLKRTPPFTADQNRFEQETEVWIGSDGSSHCERVVKSQGGAALGQRENFVEVPLGERRRLVSAELQDANSRTRLLRLAVEENTLRNFDQPVTARLSFEIPNHFSGSPEREGGLSDAKVWNRFLAYNLDYDRKVAFEFPAPFESHHRFRVHLPPGYRLESLPEDESVRSPWGTFTLKVHDLGGGEQTRDFELEFLTRLEKVRVEVGDFEEFRKFHEEVNRQYRVWLTLRPALDLEDAPLLEALLALAPQDGSSASCLARIYLHNGREADARRVLKRARYYSPREESLWELGVQTAVTPDEEEASQRELVKRFPEHPRHALALGNLLVQRDRNDQARAVLKPLAEKGLPGDRAQAHLYLAQCCYRQDKLEEALEHLDAAQTLDAEGSHSVRAQVLRGQVCEELGRPRDAEKSYRQALAVDHDNEDALDALVRLALADGKTGRALSYLRRYAVVVGEEPSGLLLAAEYYLRLNRPGEAADLASRVKEEALQGKAQRIQGLVLLSQGDFNGAANHLIQADPDATVLEGLLRVSIGLGNLSYVATTLEQVPKITEPTPELKRTADLGRRLLRRRAELGKKMPAPAGREEAWGRALDGLVCAEQVYTEGGPVTRVEELLSRTFGQGLELGPAYGLRGRLALDRGRLGKALADGERALQLSPQDANGSFVRGRVRLERNQAGALEDLEKAVEGTGRQDAAMLHGLAEALGKSGRLTEALKAQREAAKLKPGDTEIAEQLSFMEKTIGADRSGK